MAWNSLSLIFLRTTILGLPHMYFSVVSSSNHLSPTPRQNQSFLNLFLHLYIHNSVALITLY